MPTNIDSLESSHWELISDWKHGAWDNNIKKRESIHFAGNIDGRDWIVLTDDTAETLDANLAFAKSSLKDSDDYFKVERISQDSLVILRQLKKSRLVRPDPTQPGWYLPRYGNGAELYVRK
jgi:hypothetical protein